MAQIEWITAGGNKETPEQRRERIEKEEQKRLEQARQIEAEKKRQIEFVEAEKKRRKAYIEAQAAAWEKALKTSKRELFNAESGKVEKVPETRSAEKLHEDFLAAFKSGAEIIPVADALIKGGKLNLDFINTAEHFTGIPGFCRAWEVINTVQSISDPCFDTKGVCIYGANISGGGDSSGRYWALKGNALYMVADKQGQPIAWNYRTEGYKAKQARLKAEAEAAEAERKRLAAIEAERKEKERQEKQLETLKALPTNKFARLFSLLK